MWENPQAKDKEVYRDVNKEIAEIHGELSEEKARELLGLYLRHNLGFTTELLTGIKLYPEQVIYIKSWFENNFNLCIAGRGCAKSTLAGIFSILYCLFNPGVTVLIVSQNFRSSRRILENIERIALSPAGKLLRQIFKNDKLSRRGDLFQWEMINESRIICVPLSNGEGLRGLRANVLIVDEALLVPMKIIEEILQPFLVASGDIRHKQRVRDREDKKIKKGLMKEEDRKVFKSTSKMILLSSASYQWEDLYKVYQKYLEKARDDSAKSRKVASYSVLHFGYESVPKDMLDAAILEDIKSAPQSTIDKEYRAIFIESTRSYYNPRKMEDCTIKPGNRPTVELTGEPGAEYVLGIDPSFSSSEASDNFAMCLMKIVEKDGKKIGMVVNQYAVAGGSQKDHILYLFYLLKNFNIVYIGIDASGGDNNEFINSCNNSQQFKNAHIELRDIDADFHRDDINVLPQQILRSYNFDNKRIVQKQGFHSAFQRSANEYLVSCVEHGNIAFAGTIETVDGLGEALSKTDLSLLLDIKKGHSSFNDPNEGGIYVFMEEQGRLIKQVKDECTLIEITTSALGTVGYDLPPNLKRSKSANRARKDSYSALLLANWCTHLYLLSKEMPKENISTTFKPILI